MCNLINAHIHTHTHNVNRHRSNHLARNHPRKEPSPICRPKPIFSLSPRYIHVKRPTRVRLLALQPTNARFTTGRGIAFRRSSGGRYKRHAARIDRMSATSAATFTPTSAGTRVGASGCDRTPPEAIPPQHRQRPYPRIMMDW